MKTRSDFLVKVAYVNPPIPCRDWDWNAHVVGDEEGPNGWGSTPEVAMSDLIYEMTNMTTKHP
jgi:hypothetical protein